MVVTNYLLSGVILQVGDTSGRDWLTRNSWNTTDINTFQLIIWESLAATLTYPSKLLNGPPPEMPLWFKLLGGSFLVSFIFPLELGQKDEGFPYEFWVNEGHQQHQQHQIFRPKRWRESLLFNLPYPKKQHTFFWHYVRSARPRPGGRGLCQ